MKGAGDLLRDCRIYFRIVPPMAKKTGVFFTTFGSHGELFPGTLTQSAPHIPVPAERCLGRDSQKLGDRKP